MLFVERATAGDLGGNHLAIAISIVVAAVAGGEANLLLLLLLSFSESVKVVDKERCSVTATTRLAEQSSTNSS